MTDPFLTRDWAEHQHRFSASVISALGSAWRTLRVSLDRLNAYEFDAPWRHDHRAQ